jgi:hypothetical protein
MERLKLLPKTGDNIMDEDMEYERFERMRSS